MKMKSNFGPLAKTYERARRGYPEQIYTELESILTPDPHVLDVGCGTGISTRELRQYFKNITGLDIDANMLIEAKAHNDQIKYIQGDIRSTKLENDNFDLVTAFSAFHWFTNKEDIQEIYRILRPNGVFCTVNKTDTNELRSIFKNVLGQFDVTTETSVKTGAYNPKSLMEEGGFTNVSETLFEHTEWYDIEGALLLMQSWNAWSYLNDEQKSVALTEIRGAYQDLCDQDGKIARTLEIKMVIGRKLEKKQIQTMQKEIHLRNGRGYDQYIDLLKKTTEWIAEQYNISPDSMRFTCGATGALDAVLSLFDQGSVLATMPFEYFDIRRLAEARGLLISTQQQPDNIYINSIATFTQWLQETKPDGCYISLPNNPNGQEYSKESLKDVFAAMKGRIVIIDQSLLADEIIPFEWLVANRAQSRLYVVRSFSKSHGLVGERIGMLFSYDEANKIHTYAHAPSASSLQRLRKKWTSSYAVRCLRMINRNHILMTDWSKLHKNLFVAPSKTNCTCIHFHDISAQEISRHLNSSGVFVNTNIDLGSDGNFIRVDITVHTKSIKRLMSCIDEYFAKH